MGDPWPTRSHSSRTASGPPSPPSPVATTSTRWCDRRIAPTPRPTARSALAKALGRNPREVAADVLAAADLAGVAAAEIAGPGFINLTLEPSFLAGLLADVAGDDRLGVAVTTDPKRIVVDYSAPNVAKEMHIGHLRTTVIGDALVRMLDFVGHDVVKENHIGDWGRPFGMLIEHLVDLGGMERAATLGLGDLDAFYKQANAKFADDADFQERARARVVALQQGDDETLALWRALVAPERRALERRLRQARRPAHRRRHRRREPLRVADARGAPSASPPPVCWRSPTAPRSCSHPGSRTATATRSR